MQQDEPKTNEDIIEPYIEEADFNNPDYIFLPKGNHIYKQRGYYIVCESCDLVHAVFIGPDKIMVGVKKGQPILKTRKELGMV